MSDLPRATEIAGPGAWSGAADRIALDHEGRFLRRKRLVAEGGLAFLADLAETASLEDGAAFVLDDGRHVEVIAAEEPLCEVRGDLPRLAWHIGNRHTPCQIGPDHLRIRRDHVLRAMLEGLGAEVAEVSAPFRPEGGAYGEGRTMGHDVGHGHGQVQHHTAHYHLSDEDEGPADEEA